MADKNVDLDAIFNKKNNDKTKKIKISPENKGTQNPSGKNEDGKKGLMGGALYFLFVISVSVILACLAWAAATDVLGFKASDTVATITLPKDTFTYEEVEYEDEDGNKKTKKEHYADIGYVADELKEQGIIKYKWLFKLFASVYNADEKIDPGTYELKAVYDYKALIKKMTSGSGAMVTKKITFPEGYSMNQIFKKLDEEGVCDYDELMDAAANATFNYSFLEDVEKGEASRLEGFLFPDTYEFYEGMPASSAINKLLEGFHYKLTAEMLKWQEESGYSMREIITIASMIEKEAANDSDRYKIASVIYNRLCSKLYPCLEIDATIQYALAERKEVLSNADKGVLSPYNTYTNAGLPAGPIANPGMNSIRASLYPAETNYYFYALDTTGVHHFSETYYEHQNFLNELAGKEEEETQPDGAEQTEETADTENQTDG